jgi:hypothetical protein
MTGCLGTSSRGRRASARGRLCSNRNSRLTRSSAGKESMDERVRPSLYSTTGGCRCEGKATTGALAAGAPIRNRRLRSPWRSGPTGPAVRRFDLSAACSPRRQVRETKGSTDPTRSDPLRDAALRRRRRRLRRHRQRRRHDQQVAEPVTTFAVAALGDVRIYVPRRVASKGGGRARSVVMRSRTRPLGAHLA